VFDIELLQRKLHQDTGYEINLRDEKTIDFMTPSTAPIVYVGHTGIRLQDPHEFWADGYQEMQNPQLLITTMEFICLHTELHIVRNNLYRSYSLFDPVPDDNSFSHLSLITARTAARSGNKIWWVEEIGMIFPRLLR
jgi:hypothetical protein